MSQQTHTERPSPAELVNLRQSLGITALAAAETVGYSVRQYSRFESGDSPVRPAVYRTLEALLAERRDQGTGPSFIDLFAGIGGFHLGFRNAIQGRCAFTCEWDKQAQKTYKANFPGHGIAGDIREVEAEAIPDHDILLAGFPCQPFSIAGVSKKNALGRKHGFECETQGTLFFDIERVIEAKQPKAFVLENVRNLISHDRGNTFRVIRATLEQKLGYNVTWRVIDARRWVPQHRERIFIIGLHPDLNSKFDFDDIPTPIAGPTLKSILHPVNGRGPVEDAYTDPKGRPLEKYVLSDRLWQYLQDYASKHRAKGNGFGFGLVGPKDTARTLSARYYKDGSEILVARGRGNPRRLTPRECARLMGFDRSDGDLFQIPVSDTQAYKQFGNAVAVPVVEAIAKALLPYVKGERTGPLGVAELRREQREMFEPELVGV